MADFLFIFLEYQSDLIPLANRFIVKVIYEQLESIKKTRTVQESAVLV